MGCKWVQESYSADLETITELKKEHELNCIYAKLGYEHIVNLKVIIPDLVTNQMFSKVDNLALDF